MRVWNGETWRVIGDDGWMLIGRMWGRECVGSVSVRWDLSNEPTPHLPAGVYHFNAVIERTISMTMTRSHARYKHGQMNHVTRSENIVTFNTSSLYYVEVHTLEHCYTEGEGC